MPAQLHIRPVAPADAETWRRLRTAHWPDGAQDHGPEIAAFFAGTAAKPQAVFLAECDGQALALLELSIRTDLPMLRNVKVGYIEGLYIVPEFRGRGLARQLLRTGPANKPAPPSPPTASAASSSIPITASASLNPFPTPPPLPSTPPLPTPPSQHPPPPSRTT